MLIFAMEGCRLPFPHLCPHAFVFHFVETSYFDKIQSAYSSYLHNDLEFLMKFLNSDQSFRRNVNPFIYLNRV